MRTASTACWPASDEELLVPKDDCSDDLLQTKMYEWLPDWFRTGDSFFGVDKAVKIRLNDEKQKGQGVDAKLKQLQEELECSPRSGFAFTGILNNGYRSERSDGSGRRSRALTCGDREEDDRETKEAKLRFYQRFIEEKEKKKHCELDPEVKQLRLPKNYEGRYQPGLYDVCGPPLRNYMPWATLGHLVATILMPLLAVTSSQCEGTHEILAKYPHWWWFPFFLWVFLMVLLEWKCFTYTVVPLIGISGPKRVFCMDANFGVWAFCFIALSLVTQSEVWSQGLLVASAVRASLDCKGWKETLEPAWSKAWKDSMWAHFEPGGNLLVLAGLAWGFLVLQLIVYIFRAVPVKLLQCGRVEYGCGTEPNGYTVPVFCMRVWHADAMKTMASLNRMVLVLDGQTEYAINRAYFKLLSDPKQNPFDFFHILKMDMRFMLFDAFFVNLLLNGAKLQFQTSYWALLMYANLDVNVRWTQFTLCLTHLTCAHSWFRKLIEWQKVRESRIMVREEFRTRMAVADWREYDKLVFFQRSVAVVLTLQFLFQLLCAIKFCMSKWYCESHLWNLLHGCVEGLKVVDATNFD